MNSPVEPPPPPPPSRKFSVPHHNRIRACAGKRLFWVGVGVRRSAGGTRALEGLSELMRVGPAAPSGVDRRDVRLDGLGVSARTGGTGGGRGLEAEGPAEGGTTQ